MRALALCPAALAAALAACGSSPGVSADARPAKNTLVGTYGLEWSCVATCTEDGQWMKPLRLVVTDVFVDGTGFSSRLEFGDGSMQNSGGGIVGDGSYEIFAQSTTVPDLFMSARLRPTEDGNFAVMLDENASVSPGTGFAAITYKLTATAQ